MHELAGSTAGLWANRAWLYLTMRQSGKAFHSSATLAPVTCVPLSSSHYRFLRAVSSCSPAFVISALRKFKACRFPRDRRFVRSLSFADRSLGSMPNGISGCGSLLSKAAGYKAECRNVPMFASFWEMNPKPDLVALIRLQPTSASAKAFQLPPGTVSVLVPANNRFRANRRRLASASRFVSWLGDGNR